MTATFVTAAELKANLGIGTLYDATDVVETVCQTAQDLIDSMLWYNSYPVLGAAIASNVGYLLVGSPESFVAGQSITLTNCGAPYNGTVTITSTWPYSAGSGSVPAFPFVPSPSTGLAKGTQLLAFALTHADDPFHKIVPFGKAAGQDTKDVAYALVPAVREAAMMIAVDVFQSRQQSSAGGQSPDFSPSPYRMGNSLLGRVRGLIANYTNPSSMVG